MPAFTTDLHFASFLVATRRLPFRGCVPGERAGQVQFVFEAGEDEKQSLYDEFLSGAPASCVEFCDALKRLRRAIDETTRRRRP
jgi:hypothetical protein